MWKKYQAKYRVFDLPGDGIAFALQYLFPLNVWGTLLDLAIVIVIDIQDSTEVKCEDTSFEYIYTFIKEVLWSTSIDLIQQLFCSCSGWLWLFSTIKSCNRLIKLYIWGNCFVACNLRFRLGKQAFREKQHLIKGLV